MLADLGDCQLVIKNCYSSVVNTSSKPLSCYKEADFMFASCAVVLETAHNDVVAC